MEQLVGLLPDEATVLLVGWPDLASEAVAQRGDPYVLVAEVHGEAGHLVRRLERCDMEAREVPLSGLGSAVAACDLVLVEATASGPDGVLCVAGSRSAAALARTTGVPVWAVVGVGRRLPERLWYSLLERVGQGVDPWELDDEVVPIELIDRVIGPGGDTDPAAALAGSDCPMAPELLRSSAM
ncbi:MAG: hypothetical protein R2705_10030 [Ilumatobacteraceae bacterium]